MTLVEKEFTMTLYRAVHDVDEEHHLMRLDQFAQIHLPSFSRQTIQKMIDLGDVSILNRQVSRSKTRLHFKDRIEILIKRTTHEDEIWDGLQINNDELPRLLFEDEDLIACSKPAFMTTHPTGRHIFYCATVYFESLHKKTIHSIHRLDRETSGILLLAKNPKTAQIVSDLFLKDRIQKCYFLIAHDQQEAENKKDHFTAKENLGSIDSDDERERVFIQTYPEGSSEGKHAETRFIVFARQQGMALALAFPKTGRQHQIRVHAAHHGLPLLGDKIYHGGIPLFKRFKDDKATKEDITLMQLPRQALHAIALRFLYRQENKLLIDSLPTDFKNWLTQHHFDCASVEETIQKLVKVELAEESYKM
jgi:RluA family pseudouridine synthase